jgi:predicted NBD/HSP70 family sugar kinase
MAAGLVTELEPVSTQRAGRPAVPLVPARGTIAAVGMEVNVDYLGVRALDLAGRALIERVELGDFRGSDPRAVLERLGHIAERVVTTLAGEDVRVVGTALALPGLVDRVTGPLRIAPNLGWRDVDVVGLLTQRSPLADFPPRLANEANLAARAELQARRGSELRSFVYVSGEVGIGGAIVVNGEIFPGRFGWSGEIGHTVLGTDGTGPGGGRLEDYAGQDALLARAGLSRSSSVAALVDAVAAGQPQALESVRAAGAALGVALANVINIVDVGHIVLGGVYARLAPYLEAEIVQQCRSRVISAPWSPVQVSVAEAGDYPAMSGAAIAVLRVLAQDPVALLGE